VARRVLVDLTFHSLFLLFIWTGEKMNGTRLVVVTLLMVVGQCYAQTLSMGCDSTCLASQTFMQSVIKASATWAAPTVKSALTPAAQCGPSADSVLPSAPSTFLCTSGTASSVSTTTDSGDTTYTWTCTSGATQRTCNAYQRVSGACGAANGQTYSSTPSENGLCSAGGAMGLTLASHKYQWSCKGNYSTASCSATYASPDMTTVCKNAISSVISNFSFGESIVLPGYTGAGIASRPGTAVDVQVTNNANGVLVLAVCYFDASPILDTLAVPGRYFGGSGTYQWYFNNFNGTGYN
jgi:hypothetical protein